MELLKITNLHASVEGKEILHGVNLSVAPGEVVALMGTFVTVITFKTRFAGQAVCEGIKVRIDATCAVASVVAKTTRWTHS